MNSPYHVDFLKDFPRLQDWLNLNGFSMNYSIMSLETQTIISMWTDKCVNETKTHIADETDNSLLITYCQKCKKMEIFVRGFSGSKGSEGNVEASIGVLLKNTILDKIYISLHNDTFWN